MTAFDNEARKKANETQKRKFGKNYSAEMARRAALRKRFGSGATKKNYKNLSEEMARRANIRWQRQKDHAETDDRG